MKRENTPWRPVQAAAIEWSDQDTPRSSTFEDVYFSREDGLAESRYVFLQGNRLPQRWRQHRADENFCIAETGFGTGLNFFMTWQAWLEQPEPRPPLHYLSLELHPLEARDIRRALAHWPELKPLVDEFLASYPGLLPGQHRLVLACGQITLDLWWEDVTLALPDLASQGRPCVDAWYLDGFAPARNQAMWTPGVYGSIASLTRTDGSFSTFTAAGHVRRGLLEAGFDVSKVAGFGRKRECLQGHLVAAVPPQVAADTPWDITDQSLHKPTHVIVIGAGLAGCSAAAALARRGIRVTLLEREQLASGGSGNAQGILYTRLSRKHSALTDFALQSFRFAANSYRRGFATGQLQEGQDGALCGSFHQGASERDLDYLRDVLPTVPELAQVLSPGHASRTLGLQQEQTGLWFPDSGWLRPISICESLAATAGIQLIENCGPIELSQEHGQWQANCAGVVRARASCAIIATGNDTQALAQLDWLSLQSIRGQTTQLPATRTSQSLSAALCHEGYVAPARNGFHCIGATFNLDDSDGELRQADHEVNLQRLASALPALRSDIEQLRAGQLDGRVGFRCASPDYLPLVGPVPDRQRFIATYEGLRKNARQHIAALAPCLPGLYMSCGHGSRGLSSTPLAAELLASQITGEALPLSRELCRALSPARFLIRDLARNRI